jgi:hypothetical protein
MWRCAQGIGKSDVSDNVPPSFWDPKPEMLRPISDNAMSCDLILVPEKFSLQPTPDIQGSPS